MKTRIREVRRARNLTLREVAERCDPLTTPQTIGRLETGTRTVSVDWLNRIADALEVEAADLITLPDRAGLRIAAILDHEGAHAPRRDALIVPPQPDPELLAMTVSSSVGDYRSGDEIWLRRIEGENHGAALNRDVLISRPAGRFVFGRLIDREPPSPSHPAGRLQILPPGAGQRQSVIADPLWLAVAVRLTRKL